MTGEPLGGDTVTVVGRRLVVDDQGHPVTNELGIQHTEDVTVPVEGCSFEELRSEETNTDINPGLVRARVFLPCTADVLAIVQTSALIFDGQTYEVQGPRRLWTDLDGNPDHIVVTCVWREF